MDNLQDTCTEMAFLLGMATYLIVDLTKYVAFNEAQRDSIACLLRRIEKVCYKDDKNVPKRGDNPGDTPICRADGDNEGHDNPA